MPVNSYRDDEKTIEVGKMATLGRLFKYLLAYKLQIVGVLFIMGFCVVVTLLNPLIMEFIAILIRGFFLLVFD